MSKLISIFLSIALITVFTFSASGSNPVEARKAVAGATEIISDDESSWLVGRDDRTKKFMSGLACGLGLVAIGAGLSAGVFTGGLTGAIALMGLGASTASACAEAY